MTAVAIIQKCFFCKIMDIKQCTCILLLTVIQYALEVTEAQNITNSSDTEVPGSQNVTGDQIPKLDLSNKTVAGSFARHHIVPDVIPVAPTNLANVTFPNGVKASLGNKLTPSQVRYMPNITWNADSSQYYTLVAIDPDFPSRQSPVYRSTLHWCVVNITGNNITSGTTTAEYIGAGPPYGTGMHRFVFLVYQHPGDIIFNETKLYNTSSDGRHGFSIADFTLKYNLSDPIAGNFFQTSYDSYVPVLYKLLGYSKANLVTPENLIISIFIATILWHVM